MGVPNPHPDSVLFGTAITNYISIPKRLGVYFMTMTQDEIHQAVDDIMSLRPQEKVPVTKKTSEEESLFRKRLDDYYYNQELQSIEAGEPSSHPLKFDLPYFGLNNAAGSKSSKS